MAEAELEGDKAGEKDQVAVEKEDDDFDPEHPEADGGEPLGADEADDAGRITHSCMAQTYFCTLDASCVWVAPHAEQPLVELQFGSAISGLVILWRTSKLQWFLTCLSILELGAPLS